MVSNALYTGLSGLRVHQNYIDIIGNNLANVSTAGFRGSRATFSDLLSYTVSSGSGPSGNFGGLNPLQIGHGATVSTVDVDTNQGTFQDTGRPLDVGLQGRGFFTLTDGQQQIYTRVGTFGIDAGRQLVDMRTGYRVMSTSGSGITVPITDTQPASATTQVTFQGNLPATISGPLEEIVQTSTVLKEGTAAQKQARSSPAGSQFNLTTFTGRSLLVSINGGAQQTITFPSATFGGGPVNASTVASVFVAAGLQVTSDDTAQTIDFSTIRLGRGATLKFDDTGSGPSLLAALGLDATMATGTETVPTATGATPTGLNQLTARNAAYADGDRIAISGTNPDGTVFSNTFVYGAANNGTTVKDLLDFINQNALDQSQALATLTPEGHIRVAANARQPANLSLFIGDANGNTGSVNWPNIVNVQEGTGPDTATTAIDVIDSQGRTHTVDLKFTRSTTDTKVWDLEATIDPTEGTITQSTISQIRFNDDGSFNVIGGGNNSLTFSWNGISSAQSILVDLGTSGRFDGVAMLGSATTVTATDQDGYGSGTLLNVAFDQKGNLTGFYSNGQSQVLDTLRISLFPNEAGLLRVGDTLFVEAPNSDDAIATVAGVSGAGSVRPGALENSNVDIAREFVNLIEAQRGFQANSRVITTTDEMLAELMNIVR